MNFQKYVDRNYSKFDHAVEVYEKYLLHPVCTVENVLSYTTDEHLRVPPTTGLTPITPGTKWGREWSNTWLIADITVPQEADGAILCAVPDAHATEILCFKDGVPTGLINSKNQFLGGMHSAMFVSANAKAGEKHTLAFECYAGHGCLGCFPYENYGNDNPDVNYERTYDGLQLFTLDTEVRDFLFDMTTVLQMARLPGDNFVAMRAHECLCDCFPYLVQDSYNADEEEIKAGIRKMRELLAPALVKKPGGDRSRGYVGVIGHSHMDTAWLWPVAETIRKCARTYAEVLTLMDMYPEYTFIQSSALHLDWMRQYYPAIFEGIKQRVREGRYEPNGGVWVECDCNITGGEAMVRQFLYGQRFTEKYLGYRSDAFWLPDTFGYNAAIPQIMLGSGIKYFNTTKIAWSDMNDFPTDSFVWRGLDGSEVLTHLNRIHVMPDVKTLTETVKEIKDKHSNDARLVAYGFGDGGGGPTYGMLEYLKRTEDLEGMPTVESTSVSRFMDKLNERRDRLPVYDGELYLEFHRGTLTQMHDVKKNNRAAEIALHNMELLEVLSGNVDNEERDDLYRELMRNQFHDILPGTCIPEVYKHALPEVRAVIDKANAISAKCAVSLAQNKQKDAVSLLNVLSFPYSAPVTLDGDVAFDGVVSQTYTDNEGNVKTTLQAAIPAGSALVLTKGKAANAKSAFTVSGSKLDTPLYSVTFDDNGYIASLIDKRVNREVRRAGGAPLGTLWFGEHLPVIYDNWEVEDDMFRKLFPATDLVRREVVSDGAVEYRVRATYRLSKHSTATVDTVFYAENPRIDYDVKLDWNERHAILKAGFDVNVRSAFVKNEIQFGHMDRPTTRNNSVEAAKFEVCNHKWSDLSESRYGVAVLNDCKYGMSCEGSDMRLTVQKGCCRPDPVTDVGVHTMTYSLLPHVGAFSTEAVTAPAYMLNYKPLAVDGDVKLPQLFSVDCDNIIAEAVKAAEDVPGAFVLRLYEAERSVTNCRLTLPGAKAAYVTNMLEEDAIELPMQNGVVDLTFKAFEIKTILVKR